MDYVTHESDQQIDDLLSAICACHSDILILDKATRTVRRLSRKDEHAVGIVVAAWGGYGPNPALLVGKGMLDAVCFGTLTKAPTANNIWEAAKSVNTGAGVLFIIRNDENERNQFALASEMAKSAGIDVLSVIVDDYISAKKSYFKDCRKSSAGIILIYKIIGAYAEKNESLSRIAQYANLVIESTRTITSIDQSNSLGNDKNDLIASYDDVAITNNFGQDYKTKRTELMDLVNKMVLNTVEDLPYLEEEEVALLVNNLGGNSFLDLYAVGHYAIDGLKKHNIRIYKTYIGGFYSSQDESGFSISLLRLNSEYKQLLNFPVNIAQQIFHNE